MWRNARPGIATGKEERKILSGRSTTASKTVRDVKRVAKNWEYGRVSLGFPGPVIDGVPLSSPDNPGSGWVGFDFAKAFGRPVKVIR